MKAAPEPPGTAADSPPPPQGGEPDGADAGQQQSGEPGAQQREPKGRPPVVGYRGYFPAVDGLRGLAILSVLLYHTSWFSNGLFGVDVFMVLSGFLITLLLLREKHATGRIRIFAFYVRRFKRLTPALVVTLLLTVGAAFLCGTLPEVKDLSWQAVAALGQFANWAQISHGQAYWTGFGQVDALGHMWSLSITEQFYLVWPLVLTVLLWVCRRSTVAVTVLLLLLLGGAATVAPLLYNGSNSDALYLSTQVRAVGFVAGGAGAAIVHAVHLRRARKGYVRPAPGESAAGRAGFGTVLLTLLGLLALGALVAASVVTGSYHEPWLYTGGIAGVAVVASVLTACLCHDRGPLVRVFSFGPLVEIGKMSYAMYLIHLPIYWLLLKAVPTIRPYALLLVGGLFSWLFSLLLHYVVTERVRQLRWRLPKAVPILAVSCAAVVFGAQELPKYYAAQMRPDGKPVVLTLGDSLANDYASALAEHGAGKFAVVDDGVPGCGVMGSTKVEDATRIVHAITPACRAWNRVWAQEIGSSSPSVIVVHLDWDATAQLVDGRWLTPCDEAYRERYLNQLDLAATVWADAAPKAPVLVSNDRDRTGAVPTLWGHCYNQILTSFVVAHSPQVRLLDLQGALCPGGRCRTETPGGEDLFKDSVHFTDDGLDYITPFLESNITAALAKQPPPQP
ncbi:acyltransferase family protein [Kitasatospora viridis]|uniref:Peptidoglycan/LPS O-acetylase OafA/YrhL n=1 Tax=Kitasatospora viridis TaxID=281105 RepID=A0A561UF66_9ACTN|nr:acyltransferase family protein [Kitasatospora viridis]TWF98003.1 peptidoglycan/LPS O-acetylase OafA/YrhL [Kitasatospora viridis]